jgi:hypothetical protein
MLSTNKLAMGYAISYCKMRLSDSWNFDSSADEYRRDLKLLYAELARIEALELLGSEENTTV